MWLILVIMLVGIFYLATLRGGHNWGDDFAMYIHHAKNIAEGTGYKETGYINNPSTMFAPPTYPPVLPVLLSPVYYWWGENLTAMKVELILIFLFSLYMIFLAFRDELPFPYLVALVAAIGFNPIFWQFKENVLSEFPFLVFSYLSLFLIDRTYKTNWTEKSQTLNIILAGLSIYLAYGTRSIGLVLIPCLIAYDLITNRRPSPFAIKTGFLAIALVTLQNLYLHSDLGYGRQLIPILDSASQHVVMLIELASEYWVNSYSIIFRIALFAIISGLVVIGYFTRVKERMTCFEIYTILYLALLIFFLPDLDTRYLIPIVPMILFYLFYGIHIIFRHRKMEKAIFTSVVVAIFASYVARYTKLDYGPVTLGIAKSETRQLFDYVKNETGENDVFLFRKPRALALFTGRKATIWHPEPDDEKLWSYFRQISATYLILGPKYFETYYDQGFISKFVNRNPDRFEETYSNPDFRVYRIRDVP